MKTATAGTSNPRKRAAPAEPEDRFVHYVKLPTLREMASNQIALSIWYNYIATHSKPRDEDEDDDEYCEDTLIKALGIDEGYSQTCDQMVESLKTSPPIEQMLKSVVKSVRNETETWIEGCQYRSYEEIEECYHVKHFDVNWCVWLPNGRIDLPKTGLKMLASGKLTLEQRFGIMSEFCMAEELKKLPWRTLNKSFVGFFSMNSETYLMYYWIRYLRNKLSSIPLQNFKSLDARMAERCLVEHCTAFQYFFNRVPDNEKVSVAVLRFRNLATRTYQDHCLSSLSWKHQKQLVAKACDNMMMKFWIFMRSPEAAMWVWKHSKHSMTPGKFGSVVQMVFSRKVDSEADCRLILEIWRSASDQQKAFVTRSKGEHIIKPFIEKSSHSKAAFEFLYEFLSAKNADFRKQTLLKNAAQLGAHVKDAESMERIIQLCLPNPADQMRYRSLATK